MSSFPCASLRLSRAAAAVRATRGDREDSILPSRRREGGNNIPLFRAVEPLSWYCEDLKTSGIARDVSAQQGFLFFSIIPVSPGSAQAGILATPFARPAVETEEMQALV